MTDGPARTLRVTVAAAAAAALLALGAAAALGNARAGFALALGLLIGSANGLLARRGLASGLPVSATSLGRLALLSAAGLAAGFLIGADVAWLVLIGVAGAQGLLALAAAREMLRR